MQQTVKSLFGIFIIFVSTLGYSQNIKWNKSNEQVIHNETDQRILPQQYLRYNTSFATVKNSLRNDLRTTLSLSLPMPNGELHSFELRSTPVFDEELSRKYPEITSYTGLSQTLPGAVLKLSVSHLGLDAMILDQKSGDVFIDPVSKDNPDDYIVYYKKDYQRKQHFFKCSLADPDAVTTDDHQYNNPTITANKSLIGDCQLRTYRLALSCTGEYAQFHGGNIPSVLAAYNRTMTRVNGLYEKDLAVTMKIVAGSENLIFLFASTDPFTNNNGELMLGENQKITTATIGTTNYDIGHVFSTSGGGIASLSSVCNTNRKAQGVTGQRSPTGDSFDIDYVAHEMGHQFGANHTQNNDCNRSRNNAVEPGSGSTIMAYAGICSPNVQNNSNAYFHANSLAEISNFIVAGSGNNCAVRTQTGNEKPNLTLGKSTYSVPRSTPFYLEADTVDTVDEVMTYTWEQMNIEVAIMPPSATATGGPSFRSISPSTSPRRYFPDLKRRYGTWEVLPSVNRRLNFRCTVRDNNPAGGCTDEVNAIVNITNTSGPFVVQSPNTSKEVWLIGSSQIVKWDVAKTNLAPVNAATVDIRLSVDGGQTYPILLASDVPNNGTYEIMTPGIPSKMARIWVSGHGNIFFDVSNANFTIALPYDITDNPKEIFLCDAADTSFTLRFTKNITDSITLTPIVLNADLEVSLSKSTLLLDDSLTITLSNLTALAKGKYQFAIALKGKGPDNILTYTVYKQPTTSVRIEPVYPLNGQDEVKNPVLRWNAVDGINQYKVTLARNPAMTQILNVATVSDTIYNISNLTDIAGLIYWKVSPISACLDIISDEVFSFNTERDRLGFVHGRPLIINPLEKALFVNDNLSISNFGQVHTKLIIRELPMKGQLTIDNQAVNLNDTITLIDFMNEKLSYQHLVDTAYFDEVRLDIINDVYGNLQNQKLNVEILKTGFHSIAFLLQGLTCADKNDAQITAFAYGGGPFTYRLNDGPESSIYAFFNLSAGTYKIEIIRANKDSRFHEVTVPEVPSFTFDPFFDFYNMNLNIKSDGKSFEVSWSKSDSLYKGIDTVFYDLPNDTYNIEVTTSTNCIITKTLTLDVPPITGIVNIVAKPNCPGEKHLVEVNALGGFGPYQYLIGKLSSLDSITQVPDGKSIVSIKDAGKRTRVIDSIDITPIAPMAITFRNDKLIFIPSVTGGTAPYSFSFDGIIYSTKDTLLLTAPGTVNVSVRDANGCEEKKSFFINYFTQVSKEIRNVSCAGKQDGRVILNAANGLFPFEYSFEGSTFLEIRIFDNLAAGTYNYKVKDNNNDTITGMVTVLAPDTLELDVMIVSNNATAIVTGGTPPYRYSLDNGDVFIDGNEFSELPNGSLTIIVRDKNGCTDSLAILINSTLDVLGNDIRLYPNPTTDVLTLDVSQYEYQTLSSKIVSVEGKEIDITVKKENNRWIFNTQTLIPGFYILEVTLDGKVLRRSFVKR